VSRYKLLTKSMKKNPTSSYSSITE